MTKFFRFAALAFALSLAAPALPTFAQEAGREGEGADNDGDARYSIFQGTLGDAPVTILVDMGTGRTWMLTHSVSGGFS